MQQRRSWREWMLYCVIVAAAWVTADVAVKASGGPYEGYVWAAGGYTASAGLGTPAILVGHETSPGVGWSGMILYLDEYGDLQQIYSSAFTPGEIKAYGIRDGLATITAFSADPDGFTDEEEAVWDAVIPDPTVMAALPSGGSICAGCTFWDLGPGNIMAVNSEGVTVSSTACKAYSLVAGGTPFFPNPASADAYNALAADWSTLVDCLGCGCGGFAQLGQPGLDDALYSSCTGECDGPISDVSTGSFHVGCCVEVDDPDPPSCSGTCNYIWWNLGGGFGQWFLGSGGCGDGCKCCAPDFEGYAGQVVNSPCVATDAFCGDPPPTPCQYGGGDADGDGCCDSVDCDPADNTKCGNCEPGPCEGQGGDFDGDGCCDNVDCDPNNAEYCSDCPEDDPCDSQGGDRDGDFCCDNTDYDPTDPAVCSRPDEETECGSCKWRVIQNPNTDPEQPNRIWDKVRGCLNEEDCECKPPEDEPLGYPLGGTAFTDCKSDCECQFDFVGYFNRLRAKLVTWWPSLEPVGSGQTSWTLQIPFVEASTIDVVVDANPQNWDYFSSVGEYLRLWSRAFCALAATVLFFRSILMDIQTL